MKKLQKPVTAIATPSASKPSSKLMELYYRYENLAYDYAKDLYNTHRIGLDYDDIVQELKIKVYTSLVNYANKWREWREGKVSFKPMNIEIYIKSALVNKTRDFIKEISNAPIKSVSIEGDNFDYSIFGDMRSEIVFAPGKYVCIINEIDFLKDLNTEHERACFVLYLRGYSIKTLNKMFARHFVAEELIENQLTYIRHFEKRLLHNHTQQHYSYQPLSED